MSYPARFQLFLWWKFAWIIFSTFPSLTHYYPFYFFIHYVSCTWLLYTFVYYILFTIILHYAFILSLIKWIIRTQHLFFNSFYNFCVLIRVFRPLHFMELLAYLSLIFCLFPHFLFLFVLFLPSFEIFKHFFQYSILMHLFGFEYSFCAVSFI